MTLNLILTSKDAVYLSGDFRLTSISDQTPIPDSYAVQKLIPVIRQDWTALIAHMGVVSAPPVIDDMGRWIVEQVDSIPFDAALAELSRRLLELNPRLVRIRGDRRIAFSVVGFQKQGPFMILISNFLNPDGQVVEASPQLRGYIRRPNQPEIRAVGSSRPDVFERVQLERLLKVSAARRLVPEWTRRAVAKVNAAVAKRSRGWVSEECLTGYVLRSGKVSIGPHGIPEGAAYLPEWVRQDLEKEGGLVSRICGLAPAQGAFQASDTRPVR